MISKTTPQLERARVKRGLYASTAASGCNGAFELRGPTKAKLYMVVSDGTVAYTADGQPDPAGIGWEHVSVSVQGQRKKRVPNWAEMCFVKDLWWGAEECVVQFHPPHSEYVSMHNYTLHLWKPHGSALPLPPSLLVGLKGEAGEQVRQFFEGK